jgi:hypothetical protein
MSAHDAEQAVILAAATLHTNAAPLPPGSYAVMELDYHELGIALAALYKARKAERDASTQLKLIA